MVHLSMKDDLRVMVELYMFRLNREEIHFANKPAAS